MLPAAHRLTDGEGFRTAVRHGHRVGSATLVVHLLVPTDGDSDRPARVGFVVSRAVGNAVTRNRVRRRLRHRVARRLSLLPAGAVLVVRALPSANVAPASELLSDLDRCLGRALERARVPVVVQGAS